MAAAAPVSVVDPAEAALGSIGGAAALPLEDLRVPPPLDPNAPVSPEHRELMTAAPIDPYATAPPEFKSGAAGTAGLAYQPAAPEHRNQWQQIRKTYPPPIIEKLPPPTPAPPAGAPTVPGQGRGVPTGAEAARVAIDPASGRVVNPETGELMYRGGTGPHPLISAEGSVWDPVAGRPMARGKPHEGVSDTQTATQIMQQTVSSTLENPFIAGARSVTDPVFRVLSWLANPFMAAGQVGFERAGHEVGANPNASPAEKWVNGMRGFFEGTFSAAGGRAFTAGILSPDLKMISPYSVPGIANQPLGVPGTAAAGANVGLAVGRLFGPRGALIGGAAGGGIGALVGMLGIKPGSEADVWIRGLGNFAANALLDEVAAGAQGPLTKQLMRVAGRAGEATGLYDIPMPLPGGAKSINTLKQIAADNRTVARAMAKHEGLQGPIQEAAIKAVNQANKSYEALQKLGVPLKGTGARGQPINVLDDYVYHWIEAGKGGAAYKTRAEVETEAAKLSVSPAAKKAIVQAVRDIGMSYSQAWRDVGRNLEKVGWLKPGTVDRMGGYYAAWMYESTSHNPDDIGAWMQFAQEVGKSDPKAGVSEGAYRDAEGILGSAGERGGIANAAKGRKVPTYEERVARGAVTQASPVFGKSIRGQTRVAARAGALQEIAANPEIATPGTIETPLPPKYTAQAYQEAKAAGEAAVARTAAAKTEYQAAKTASADPKAGFDAVERLQKAKSEYQSALGAQRSAQSRLRSYRGLTDSTPNAPLPQNPEEYRAAANTAAEARHSEHTAAQTAYTDAQAAFKKAKTPENELALLSAREKVRDGGIAWANAQNKIAEVEQEIATGRSGVTKSVVPTPDGSVRLVDQRYGPLNGMIVPKHVKEAVDAYLNPEPVEKGFKALIGKLAGYYKSQAMFLSFPSLLHKVKYDSVLAEGAAKDAGVAFTPAQVTRAARDLVSFRRGGKLTPAIEALSTETRAFVPRDQSLREIGGSLRNVLGLGARDIPTKTWAIWQKAGKVVPEGIGEIERTYKIALTEALAPKMGYKAAAQKAAETIGDWTMTDPTIRTLEKYGGVPFLTARVKAFPKMLSIAAKHPEVLQRWGHPKLGPSIAAAMGPGAQAQQQIAPPGSIPVPGYQSEEGRQEMVTRDPTRVEPLSDLWSLGAGVGGVPILAASALANVDFARSAREQQAESITKPGEMPPLDSDQARLDYVAQRLQPGIARTVSRVALAAQGRTKFGGPYGEPESVAQAMWGALTGTDVRAPKTQLQAKQDAAKQATQAGRAMAYAAGYMGELASGKTQPRAFPGAERSVRTLADAKAQMKNAKERIKAIAEGRQYAETLPNQALRERAQQDQLEAIRRQTEWFFTLSRIANERLAEEMGRNQAMTPR